jgi:hypothetical protein
MHTSITASRAVWKGLVPALWIFGIGVSASTAALAAPTAADAQAFVARAEASAWLDKQNAANACKR